MVQQCSTAVGREQPSPLRVAVVDFGAKNEYNKLEILSIGIAGVYYGNKKA